MQRRCVKIFCEWTAQLSVDCRERESTRMRVKQSLTLFYGRASSWCFLFIFEVGCECAPECDQCEICESDMRRRLWVARFPFAIKCLVWGKHGCMKKVCTYLLSDTESGVSRNSRACARQLYTTKIVRPILCRRQIINTIHRKTRSLFVCLSTPALFIAQENLIEK